MREKHRARGTVWVGMSSVKGRIHAPPRAPYLRVREADEALDCFSYNLLDHLRAISTQVGHAATLAPPRVAIDEFDQRSSLTPVNTSQPLSGYDTHQ